MDLITLSENSRKNDFDLSSVKSPVAQTGAGFDDDIQPANIFVDKLVEDKLNSVIKRTQIMMGGYDDNDNELFTDSNNSLQIGGKKNKKKRQKKNPVTVVVTRQRKYAVNNSETSDSIFTESH